MNKYYKKIPFKFDRQQLIDIASVYLDDAPEGYVDHAGNAVQYGSGVFHKPNEQYPDAVPPTSLYFRDLPEDFRYLKIFEDCCKLFANTKTTKKHHDLDSLYNYAQFFKITGPLLPHVDRRTAAFTIPLYGVSHPVYWFDKDGTTVLEKYTYDGPTLINTSINHGCLENIGERVFFQIGGFAEPFDELVESI